MVTGGSGYVGSVLVPVLARQYPVRVIETMHFGNPISGTPNVEFIKADIRDTSAIRAALDGVTDVLHLAAVVTDQLVALAPEYARQVNCEAMSNLCREAVGHGVQRFIYASSSSVYGTQSETCTEESPTLPETEYARTKLRGETILGPYSSRMCVCSIRSATACGPAPRMRLDTIVNIFCKQAFFDGEITVHDGTQWRSNVHVADVAQLYAYLLECPVDKINGESFNLTWANHTALELAKLVLAETTWPCTLVVREDIKDWRQYRMSGEKLQRVLSWQPRRSIVQAVRDNFASFGAGNIEDPNADVYFNDRRMADIVQGGL